MHELFRNILGITCTNVCLQPLTFLSCICFVYHCLLFIFMWFFIIRYRIFPTTLYGSFFRVRWINSYQNKKKCMNSLEIYWVWHVFMFAYSLLPAYPQHGFLRHCDAFTYRHGLYVSSKSVDVSVCVNGIAPLPFSHIIKELGSRQLVRPAGLVFRVWQLKVSQCIIKQGGKSTYQTLWTI